MRRNHSTKREGYRMTKADRYIIVSTFNGMKWLFPRESHYSEVNYRSFMIIKELQDIDNGNVPKEWKNR